MLGKLAWPAAIVLGQALVMVAMLTLLLDLKVLYLGPFVGGGIEIWFAYVLALVFLLFRPQGLFGEKIIDRV